MEPSAAVPVEVNADGARELAAPRALRAITTLALLAASAGVYSAAVFGTPFFTKGEPREAVVTQRMLSERDFVLPRRTPSEIPAKPPLFHWLGAASSAMADRVSEATVRLPSMAASLLAIALTATTGYRAFGTTAGVAAAVVLATNQQWIASSVTARVDMVLAAAVTVSLSAFLRARLTVAPFPVLFWVGCALAVLTKGPVGYVLAPSVAVAFLLVRRDLGYLRTVRAGIALAILALPLGWYAAAWQRGGDEFFEKVIAENFYRMINADAGEVGHRHSALYYFPALLAGMAPWSLLLLPASAELWRRRDVLLDESRLLAVLWSVVTVIFYSLAESKRPVYLLACYPALALLIGDWLARRFDEQRTVPWSSSARAMAWSARALSILLAALGVLVVVQTFGVAAFELFGPVLSPGDRANLGPLARAVESNALAIYAWLAMVLVLAAVLDWSARVGAWRAAFAAVALIIASTTAFASATLLRDLARSQSIREFIESAASRLPPRQPLYFYAASGDGRDLYFFRSFEYAASFYAGRPLEVVHDLESAGGGDAVWFLAADSTLGALRRAARSDGMPLYRFAERGRYTYGDNPRRTPIVLVEATRRRS